MSPLPPAPAEKPARGKAMREKDIEKKGNAYAKARGWLAYKWVSPGNTGVPDRLYFRQGLCICVEWKTPRGAPSKLQEIQINRLRLAGIQVYVLDSCDDVTLSLVFD